MQDILLNRLGEDELLSRLLVAFPTPNDTSSLVQGPGDDCAVARRDDRWDTLLKTDAVVEGIHFSIGTDPRLIGRKALARAVSDIAAMGGIPELALVNLFLSGQRSVREPENIYSGMAELAEQFHISLAGGEISSLPHDGLMLSVTLVGRVERGRSILRSGGRPGDVLCVSGPLGGSFISGRHLTFTPRVALGRELISCPTPPRAMMDISDGLSTDLPRLATACGCGYEVNEASLPLNENCTPAQALSDGEDYELLIVVAPQDADSMCSRFGLFAIGHLTEKTFNSLSGGWQHFSSSPYA